MLVSSSRIFKLFYYSPSVYFSHISVFSNYNFYGNNLYHKSKQEFILLQSLIMKTWFEHHAREGDLDDCFSKTMLRYRI